MGSFRAEASANMTLTKITMGGWSTGLHIELSELVGWLSGAAAETAAGSAPAMRGQK